MYLEIVIKDMTLYLDWDKEKIASEKEKIELLLQDATTYYSADF